MSSHHSVAPDHVRASPARGMRAFTYVTLVLLTVLAFWLVGFLPWVGASFTLGSRGSVLGSSGEGLEGARLALPLVAAQLPLLLTCSVLGGTLAGLLPHLFPALGRGLAAVTVLFVVLITTATLLLLARAQVRSEASGLFAADSRVLSGLMLVVTVGAAVGVVVGLLGSSTPGLLPLAAGLLAATIPSWLLATLVATGAVDPGTGRDGTRWVAAAVLLVLLAVSVRRHWWPVVLWPVALLVAYYGQPATTAAGYLGSQLRPSAGLPGSLPDLVDASVQVMGRAASPDQQYWWPWVVAGVLALVWLLVQDRVLAAVGRRPGR